MRKVLLVVHNRAELRRLAGAFEQKGQSIVAAADGIAGFDAFQEQHPAAVVIDVLIPKLPGGELCRRIKADPRGATTPVVVLSGLFKKTDMAERALTQWKADRYFQSPVDPKTLADEVERLMDAVSPAAAHSPAEPAAVAEPKALAVDDDEPLEIIDDEPAEVAAAEPLTDIEVEAPQSPPPPRNAGTKTAALPPPPPKTEEVELAPEEEKELDDLEATIARAVAELARHDMIDRFPRLAHIDEDLAPAGGANDDSHNPLAALLDELDGVAPKEPEDYPCELADEQDEIQPEGRLANISVPELFAHLHYAKKTGILELTARGALKQVYFDDGRAVYVESESRQESLGQVLVRQGVITEEEVMLSLANMATYGRRQGGALVQMGVVHPMQIYQALRTQMREKLLNVFQWFDGRYYFDEGPYDKTNLTMFELPMPRLILDGIHSAYAAESVVELFSEVLDQSIIPSCTLPLDRRTADLPDDVWDLFSLMDGERTIAEVVNLAKGDSDHTFLNLYAMLILRMFDRRREDERVPATPPPLPRRIPPSPPPAAPLAKAAPGVRAAIVGPSRTAAAPARGAAPKPAPPPARAAKSREELVDIDDEAANDELIVFADLPHDERTPAPTALADAEDDALFDFEDEPDAAPPERAAPARELTTMADDPDPFANAEEEDAAATELRAIDEEPPTAPEQDEALARQVVELFLKLDGANYYELLNVPREADDLTLKLAFHNLMKEFHEDKVRGRLDAELTEKAERVAQAVTMAYETLSSPKRRSEYDRRLTGEGGELKERRITTILAAERAFNQGMSAMRRQKYPDAEKAFLEACELFPEEGEYHAYLGWSRYLNPSRRPAERTALARESIERALRLNPKGDKAYFFLGKLLLAHESREKARQMFALAFRYNKNNEEAKMELRRLQGERERERAELAAHAADNKGTLSNVLKKDVDFDTVKRAVKKLFS